MPKRPRKIEPPEPAHDTEPPAGHSGIGSQTALLALIRRRRAAVERDPDSRPPEPDPRDAAEP